MVGWLFFGAWSSQVLERQLFLLITTGIWSEIMSIAGVKMGCRILKEVATLSVLIFEREGTRHLERYKVWNRFLSCSQSQAHNPLLIPFEFHHTFQYGCGTWQKSYVTSLCLQCGRMLFLTNILEKWITQTNPSQVSWWNKVLSIKARDEWSNAFSRRHELQIFSLRVCCLMLV